MGGKGRLEAIAPSILANEVDMRLRGTIEHIAMAVLIAGFALVFGFAVHELDAAVKDACSSLATIATIGN